MDIDKHITADKPETLCLNFSKVTFMDSSGVGLVMGRYRTLSAYGGKLELCEMPDSVQRIMKLSGIGKIAAVTSSNSAKTLAAQDGVSLVFDDYAELPDTESLLCEI